MTVKIFDLTIEEGEKKMNHYKQLVDAFVESDLPAFLKVYPESDQVNATHFETDLDTMYDLIEVLEIIDKVIDPDTISICYERFISGTCNIILWLKNKD